MLDKRNEEFNEVLKKYRISPTKELSDKLWILVEQCCHSICCTLTVGIVNEHWHDRKMDAVMKIMNNILFNNVNPDCLVNYCYLWCVGSMQSQNCVRIDNEYSTEVLFNLEDEQPTIEYDYENNIENKYRRDKMSSKAKKIEASIKKYHNIDLYATLIGSIVTTVCILNKKTETSAKRYFNKLKKELEINEKSENPVVYSVQDLLNKVWKEIGSDDNIHERSRIVLVYDNNEVKSPLVSIVNNDTILPLSPEGIYYGVLADINDGKENIDYEFVYDEMGQEYID